MIQNLALLCWLYQWYRTSLLRGRIPISSVAAYFVGGGTKTFWTAIGVFLGARMFFGIIECFGGILVWRLYGRKVAVD